MLSFDSQQWGGGFVNIVMAWVKKSDGGAFIFLFITLVT